MKRIAFMEKDKNENTAENVSKSWRGKSGGDCGENVRRHESDCKEKDCV